MPYTFTLPGFFPAHNLDEYGRALLRKGFGGFAGLRGGPKGSPVGNTLLEQLFPTGFGGPSRVPRRDPRDAGDSGSIGGFSNTTDHNSGTKGSISSLPKIKESAGRPAQLTYRNIVLTLGDTSLWKVARRAVRRKWAEIPFQDLINTEMGYGDEDDDGYYMRNRNGYLHRNEEDDEFTKSVAKIRNILPSIFRIKQLGERGSGFRSRGQVQDFYELRDECLQSGTLFEDPDFPCEDSSIFFSSRPRYRFEWRRPMEIIEDPQLFVEGVSRFDVQQGELGDCWLLAAVANLTLHQSLFYQIVPADQDFEEDYCGIFHFRFWQYGRWVDVVIDDRLPTVNGKLVFLHSSQPNEFWSALLEKAYAKLHGSYEALKGGSTCEAMEDFTGGVTEMYELNETAPPNLFKMMLKAYERSSLMGCSIEPDPHVLEAQTPQGLVKGHAYSITKVTLADIITPNMSGKIPLIRLRNPWGNDTEWNGPWSDKSPEWRFIPEHVKQEIGLTFDQDGEFWMCYKDFLHHFDRLEICNLNPDSLTEEEQEGKKKWDVSVFEGEWVRGVTAGGCRNNLQTFHRNPQYRITLTESDEDDEENKCTVIVALMQKNRRSQKNMGVECLTIGFAIYRLEDPDRLPKPLNLDFFKYNASCARSPSFINLREVSCRFSLNPGVYCIIPSTFDPNEEGEFILRVFSENKSHMEVNDEQIGMGKVDERIVEPSEPQDRNEQKEKDEKIRQFFTKLAGDDNEIDWLELQEILNYAMREELPNRPSSTTENGSLVTTLLTSICGAICKDPSITQVFDTKRQGGFSKDVCRSMIAMLDVDRSGKLGFEEFRSLWTDIRNWKAVFKLYDRQNTGQLSAFELREALNSAGYRLNNHILNVLVHRYGTKEGCITFDDFMMCAVKLKSMIDLFRDKDPENTNKATFTLEEWVERTLYS